MSDFLQRESNTITIANFYEAYKLGKYNFEPEYQRKSIWSEEKKSFLINSIVRNFPIPPIFLHQKIDNETGSTKYDVIDGKQRLTAIIEFLDNQLAISDEDDDEKLAGLYFEDLGKPQYAEYKKRFWRYALSIEYIDTADRNIIDSIFDRLNRNGEPLTGQELRNANYYNSQLLKKVENASKIVFWENRLEVVDRARMEDLEFISELFFFIAEGVELTANQAQMDDMYRKYSEKSEDEINNIYMQFCEVTGFLENLNLDYSGFKIGGVSHLYGLFAFSKYCIDENIDAGVVAEKLKRFYSELRDRSFKDENIQKYKNSMSARTKDSFSRRKRKESLIAYCQ
jgi:uncharacterized protein with ParB-like and HNH nuclease domain